MTMQMPAAPLPRGSLTPKSYSAEDIETEAKRLQKVINQGQLWDLETCKTIAPLTLEINELKHANDVFLIAHSYQTPDIVYGVADSVSDSYSLSKAARDAPQQTILFSSVDSWLRQPRLSARTRQFSIHLLKQDVPYLTV